VNQGKHQRHRRCHHGWLRRWRVRHHYNLSGVFADYCKTM